jgi:hypothetical protein
MRVPRGIHSLFALAVLLLLCAERLLARARHRCGCVVTCSTVVMSLACVVWRRHVLVPVGCLVVSFLGSLAHGAVLER